MIRFLAVAILLLGCDAPNPNTLPDDTPCEEVDGHPSCCAAPNVGMLACPYGSELVTTDPDQVYCHTGTISVGPYIGSWDGWTFYGEVGARGVECFGGRTSSIVEFRGLRGGAPCFVECHESSHYDCNEFGMCGQP